MGGLKNGAHPRRASKVARGRCFISERVLLYIFIRVRVDVCAAAMVMALFGHV